MKVTLNPFGNGQTRLNQIELACDGTLPSSCVLGRNSVTGLDQMCDHIQHVSRSHVLVTCREKKVFIDVVARQDHIVFLNGTACERGEIEVHSGDELSLLGSLNYFNYKFEFHPDKDMLKSPNHTQEIDEILPPSKRQKIETTPPQSVVAPSYQFLSTLPSSSSTPAPLVPVAPSIPNSSSSISSEKLIIEQLLRQYECEICYEVMACAFSLYPCGDCFCYCCIEDWASSSKKNCPHCQGEFDLKTAIPNKKMDNAVRDLLKNEKEQLESWEKRVEEGLERRKRFMDKSVPPVVEAQLPNNTQRASILSHFRFVNPTGAAPAQRNQPAATSGSLQAYPIVIPPTTTTSISVNSSRRGRNSRAALAQPPSAGVVDLTKDSQPPLPTATPTALPPPTFQLVGNPSQLVQSFHELLLYPPIIAAIKTKELTDRYYSGICQHCQCMITTNYTLALFFWKDGPRPWQSVPYPDRFRYAWNIYHPSCIQQWNRFISQPNTPNQFQNKKISYVNVNFVEQMPIEEQMQLQQFLL